MKEYRKLMFFCCHVLELNLLQYPPVLSFYFMEARHSSFQGKFVYGIQVIIFYILVAKIKGNFMGSPFYNHFILFLLYMCVDIT